MTCARLRSEVVELVLGEVGAPERAACEAHLAACSACRRERDEVARVLAAARAADTADPGSAFWDGFAERVWAQVKDAPTVEEQASAGAWARLWAWLGGAGEASEGAGRRRAWALGFAGATAAAALAIVATRALVWRAPAGGTATPAGAATAAATAMAGGASGAATGSAPGGPGAEGVPGAAGAAGDGAAGGSALGPGGGGDDGGGDALLAGGDEAVLLDTLGADEVARLADALGEEIDDQMEDAAAAVDGVGASDVQEALRDASAEELRAIERALEKVSIDDLV
ncbi:MAG TPA: hypothetical protein VG389_22355 [Myxococcota bacterium]|jgi:hypothetical protein|nr:hypothetical protein [Myxococcota bacterium]